MMKRIAVVGDGSFGVALATLVARLGTGEVRIWSHDASRVVAMNRDRRNPKYLPSLALENAIQAFRQLPEAIDNAELIFIAVPSHALRSVLSQHARVWPDVPLVLGCKGIETSTLLTMSEVALDTLGHAWAERVLALSGPSFAEEIVRNEPTAVALACSDLELADKLSVHLFRGTFRAYSSSDLIGVELGGALKNVVAIAAGAAVGLGYGCNTQSAVITRGLAEITRLAVAKGAHPMTLAGLAGMGDLVLTCTGALSRNRSFGEKLGRGLSLNAALQDVGQTVEGMKTAEAAYRMAQTLKVDVPITTAVYRVLAEGAPITDAVAEILARPPKREREY